MPVMYGKYLSRSDLLTPFYIVAAYKGRPGTNRHAPHLSGKFETVGTVAVISRETLGANVDITARPFHLFLPESKSLAYTNPN